MKSIFIKSLMGAALISGMAACNNSSTADTDDTDTVLVGAAEKQTTRVVNSSFNPDGSYVDLSTGKTVKLTRNETDGTIMNMETSQPVEFYVDMSTHDTFYAKTGTVVNYALLQEEGKYKLDDAKIKWEGDELKIKNADGSKEKITDDEYKYKSDDVKIKETEDETKIKAGDTKIKVSKDEVKVKQ